MPPRVVIVGGGISGLSAAWYLNKAGVRAVVIDRGARLGGIIRTEHRHNCVLECGPDSFISAKPWALDLIRELGLADQLIGSKDRIRLTYILKKGKLEPLPAGLAMMIPTAIWPMVTTPLVSWRTKFRMGLDLLRRPTGAKPDHSVSEFIRGHYGQEAVDYIAEPLLAGVYGGDPGRLSAASVLTRFVELEAKYGSLSRGVLAERRAHHPSSEPLFYSLKNGMETLVNALAPATDTVRGTAEAVETAPCGLRIRVNGNWMEAEQLVLAGPAYAAGSLLRSLDGETACLLEAIPYNSAITLSLAYRRESFGSAPRGSGLLAPKLERRALKAVTFVNNKFDYRAPEDIILLRCFYGGEWLERSDAELVETARRELREIFAIGAEPLFFLASRWPCSMAQYTVGHQQRIDLLHERMRVLQDKANIHLAGNYLGGIGIPDCVRAGKACAEAVLRPQVQA